jgi:hypothetical protein
MIHIISEDSLKRPGFVYDDDGVGYPIGNEPYINWSHIDGPLLFTSDCGLEWLSLWDRIKFRLGLCDIYDLDRKYRRKK